MYLTKKIIILRNEAIKNEEIREKNNYLYFL